MEGRQLTIGDNLALENGCRHLSELQFGPAIEYLTKAIGLESADQEQIQQLTDVCRFWQRRIPGPEPQNPQAPSIEDFLQDFCSYPFRPALTGLKKNLLIHIIGKMHNQSDLNADLVVTAFDQCLAIQECKLAEDLVYDYNRHHPDNRISNYLLAQAQWLQGNYLDAGNNYALGLLKYPDAMPVERIENKNLKELILMFGVEMSPAYAWIRNILPLLDQIDDINAMESAHQKALDCYRLLIMAEEAKNRNDMKGCVNYRKQLKLLNPLLYEEYYYMLKKRK
jgi:hypothetical protein